MNLTSDGKILLYLLHLLGPHGRQLLKDAMMDRAGNPNEPEAHQLLAVINKMERGLAQLRKVESHE